MTLNKRGFTLVELIVVIAMIAVFMASVGTAVGKTRERARVEKARGDVKVLSQTNKNCEPVYFRRLTRFETDPERNANVAACTRFFMPSFVVTAFSCFFTVLSPMKRRSPISLFDAPRATR